MHNININGEIDFEYDMEFSLLDSIESQQLDIDYNCRAGFCGSCKCELVNGEVEQIQTPNPVTPLKEGEILTCCSRPKSDLELRFKDKLQHMHW